MIKVKMYPAKNGDAFLIEAAGKHILIDAGYASTFHSEIAPDLKLLREAGGLLNLAVCTHIDSDHIGGMIELLATNGPPGARRYVEIEDVWHNSYRSLPINAGQPDSLDDLQLLTALRQRGYSVPIEIPSEEVPIGAQQGSSLASLLNKFEYRWNGAHGKSPVLAVDTPVRFSDSLRVRVLGPKVARLESLRAWWLKELRRLTYGGSGQLTELVEDVFDISCASTPEPVHPAITPISAAIQRDLADVYLPDTSPTNASSIVLLVEDQETSILFLGDAWAEDVVNQLPAGGGVPMLFGAVKVSHHGSKRNTSVELLRLIDSPCFLVSSDGSRHGHPDFEVLAEIVDRPAPFERRLYFNYDTEAARRLREYRSRTNTPFSVLVGARDWISIGEIDA